MIERAEVKERHEYMLDGKPVLVFMIHKPCSGESVTLCEKLPAGCENPFPYLRTRTMQMRKFQKAALKVPNEPAKGRAESASSD